MFGKALTVIFLVIGSCCAAPWEHMLLLWEDKDYKGESSYVLIRDHTCVSLISKWRNRVTSLNTNRHCYQLFEGTNCDKKSVFVYPMSKHHNDLTEIEMNDAVNSVRYCLLDERAANTSSTVHDKGLYEFPFWDFVFGKISTSDQKAFRHLANKYNYSNMPWHFIPNIRSSNPVAEQYQNALDWFISSISSLNFTLTDLKVMRTMSYKVFDDRANENAVRKSTLGSYEDAVSFQLEVYWKMIVEAIDDEIDRYLQRIDDSKIKDNGKSLRRTPEPRQENQSFQACGIVCRYLKHLIN